MIMLARVRGVSCNRTVRSAPLSRPRTLRPLPDGLADLDQSRMLYDAALKFLVDPWPEVVSCFDAQAAASDLGVSASQLSKVYWPC